MIMTILNRKFYLKDTLHVARNLLGCILCRKIDAEIYRGIIVEAEAYTQEDAACHAFKGITPRCQAMFEEGGISYVYFTYGMHYCFNVVTEAKGRGCAVLIRALEPIGFGGNTDGPAKLCKVLKINKELNGVDLTSEESSIWIEKGELVKDVSTTTRIGIKQNADYLWRFYIKDNHWVSKR